MARYLGEERENEGADTEVQSYDTTRIQKYEGTDTTRKRDLVENPFVTNAIGTNANGVVLNNININSEYNLNSIGNPKTYASNSKPHDNIYSKRLYSNPNNFLSKSQLNPMRIGNPGNLYQSSSRSLESSLETTNDDSINTNDNSDITNAGNADIDITQSDITNDVSSKNSVSSPTNSTNATNTLGDNSLCQNRQNRRSYEIAIPSMRLHFNTMGLSENEKLELAEEFRDEFKGGDEFKGRDLFIKGGKNDRKFSERMLGDSLGDILEDTLGYSTSDFRRFDNGELSEGMSHRQHRHFPRHEMLLSRRLQERHIEIEEITAVKYNENGENNGEVHNSGSPDTDTPYLLIRRDYNGKYTLTPEYGSNYDGYRAKDEENKKTKGEQELYTHLPIWEPTLKYASPTTMFSKCVECGVRNCLLAPTQRPDYAEKSYRIEYRDEIRKELETL